MQNFYLHHEVSAGFAASGLSAFRIEGEGQLVVGARGCQLELYRLLDDDLTLRDRFNFQASIQSLQVLPSRFHKHDYVWVLDKKGRFCVWHPSSIDLINNCVQWEWDEMDECFSGASWQFEERNTVGTIFYTGRHTLVLLHFKISERGVYIDQSNIIKYQLPTYPLRYANFISHFNSLFLIGLVLEQQGKTTLCVYDLEKGLGVCGQSLEWRLEKVNLLHFCSAVPGEILMVTYNQVSLHGYKASSPLRNYRTRGNYGHGFHLGSGFYGHVGEELVVFSRDKLRTYGQIKPSGLHVPPSFSNVCLTHCSILGEIENQGVALSVETYERDVYLLRLFEKSFSMTKIFSAVGRILEICCLKSDQLMAVVSQQSEGFEVSLLERQQQIEIRDQSRLEMTHIEKIITVNGGIFIIACNDHSNQVFRLSRNQRYQPYFPLPQGQILAAEDNYIAYDYAIFQVDYQCLALSPILHKNILLAEITRDVIYYLGEEGSLCMFDNQSDETRVLLTGRQHDYCWGLFSKLSILLTANLLEPKEVRVLSTEEERKVSIKGHTLVTSLCSITQKKIHRVGQVKILVGYADGQIHMHSLQSQFLHSTHMFDFSGTTPVTFISCGEDAVLANHSNKQYMIVASKEEYTFTNVLFFHSNSFLHLFGFLQKSGELCVASSGQEGTLLRRASLTSMKDRSAHSQQFGIIKLEQWSQSVPLLLGLDDRLVVAGCRTAHLIKLHSHKIIRSCSHGLKEVIALQQIKLGIILCGVDFQSFEHIIVLNEELQLICRFQLHTKPPVRCLRTVEDSNNQFVLAYDDSLTLYTITLSLQLQAVLGRKIEAEAYQVDVLDGLIVLNDPWRSVGMLQLRESITSLGIYMPARRVTHCLFLKEEILCTDQGGCITLLSYRMDQIAEASLKFTRVFSLRVGSEITAIHRSEEAVFYVTGDGTIAVVKVIVRDDFDTLKKMETEALLEMDSKPSFSYWQWRDRVPAHERIIDGQLFSRNPYNLTSFAP